MFKFIWITIFITACGGADFTTGISGIDDKNSGGNSSTGGTTANIAGASNSHSGGFSSDNGGNPVQGTGGALGGLSGSANGGLNSSGGSANLAGSANTGGSAGTVICNPKNCADIAFELGGDKVIACGTFPDDGCGHRIQCGDDCTQLPYSSTYSKCGASYKTTWANGSPLWKSNPNLCGLNCFEIDNRFSNGNVSVCESADGVPINPNIPMEVHCVVDAATSPPLPRPGCVAMGGIGFVDTVFCCAQK